MQMCDAFVEKFETPVLGAADGSLAGLTVGVKDNFDIAGTITGAGNPEYAADQKPAAKHAAAVEKLLANGAILSGKTQMDELAYSLMGLNARYGVPPNPAAPGRVPGGSSSGSASATAAGLVDIGLGTDTGGSVRLPASFCGLYGWRSSHGLISADGMVPLAASYDVTGFFTRDLDMMTRVMGVFAGHRLPFFPLAGKMSAELTDGGGSTNSAESVLHHPHSALPGISPRRGERETLNFLLPADLWSLAEPTTAEHLKSQLPALEFETIELLPEGGAAAALQAFRIHQGYEIWQDLGAWVTSRQPAFGPGIKDRFEMASRITADEFEAAAAYRKSFRAHLARILMPGTILVYPTAPAPAPRIDMPQSEMEPYRNRALSLMAVAGHGGLPQLSIPAGLVDNVPVGVSLVTANGDDHLLAEAARFFVQT